MIQTLTALASKQQVVHLTSSFAFAQATLCFWQALGFCIWRYGAKPNSATATANIIIGRTLNHQYECDQHLQGLMTLQITYIKSPEQFTDVVSQLRQSHAYEELKSRLETVIDAFVSGNKQWHQCDYALAAYYLFTAAGETKDDVCDALFITRLPVSQVTNTFAIQGKRGLNTFLRTVFGQRLSMN